MYKLIYTVLLVINSHLKHNIHEQFVNVARSEYIWQKVVYYNVICSQLPHILKSNKSYKV